MFKKGTVVKAALLAIIFFFVVMVGGCNLVQKSPEAEKKETVAKIGEQKITKQDVNYYLAIEKLNWKLQGQEFPTDEAQLSQIKSQILDVVVENQLMIQLAKKEEIPVEEEKATAEIEKLKKTVQEDLGGEEEYKKFFEENNITVKEFDGFLKEYILSNQYIAGLYEKITKDTTVTDEDIVKYYQENMKQFDPSTVEAKHILADKDHKQIAEEIVKKAKGGKDFDALMEEYKETEGIREAADLGEFEYKKMIPEFSKVAFELEPGEISDPVETEFGFHVIKVEKKNEKPVQKLEEVKDTLSTQLQQNAQQEAFMTYFQEQQEKTDVKKYPEKL